MISHDHRTIFVHIPKCGGQSIEAAFLADLGLTWELRAPLLLRPNEEPRLGPPRLAHLLARDYTRHHYVSKELFSSYYTFSILRDPVSRVVSLYNYMRLADSGQRLIDIDTFLFKWLVAQLEIRKADAVQQNASSSSFFFVRPQVDFVTDEQGAPLVKDLFFLEEIDESFPEIQAKSGLRSKLEHRNKSTQRIGKGDLTQKQVAFIREIYAADVRFIASLKAARQA